MANCHLPPAPSSEISASGTTPAPLAIMDHSTSSIHYLGRAMIHVRRRLGHGSRCGRWPGHRARAATILSATKQGATTSPIPDALAFCRLPVIAHSPPSYSTLQWTRSSSLVLPRARPNVRNGGGHSLTGSSNLLQASVSIYIHIYISPPPSHSHSLVPS